MWVIQNTEEAQSNIFGIEETNIDVYAAALELIFKFGECETGLFHKFKAAYSDLPRRKLMYYFGRAKRNRAKHPWSGNVEEHEINAEDILYSAIEVRKMSPNDDLVRYGYMKMDLNEDQDVTCIFPRKDDKGNKIKKNDQKFYDMVYHMNLLNEEHEEKKKVKDYGLLPAIGAIKVVLQTADFNILKTGENELLSKLSTKQLSNLSTSPPPSSSLRDRFMMILEFIAMILDLLAWCQWRDIWFNGPLELKDFLYKKVDRLNGLKSHRTILYQFNDTFYSKLLTAKTDSNCINGTKQQMRYNVLQALPLVDEFCELVKYNPNDYKPGLQEKILYFKDEMKDLKTIKYAQDLKNDAWVQVIAFLKEDEGLKEVAVRDPTLFL